MKVFLKKLGIGKVIERIREWLALVGIDLRQHTDDRHILENIIFPYIKNHKEYNKIVFIGTQWYTKGYCKIFKEKEFYTLEYDEKRARFGCKLNIIDSFVNIDKYFSENSVDVVICNGVFGRGFNYEVDVNKALEATRTVLKKDGLFIFGWDDHKKYFPYEVEKTKGFNLFTKYKFEPLETNRYVCNTNYNHTYLFLGK
jgi:hypothetical protein